MAKILVTGSAGYVAGWLIPQLLRMGHHVIGYDCLKCPDHLINLVGVEWHQGFLSDRTLLERVFSTARPDICIHLAKPAAEMLESYTPEERHREIQGRDLSVRVLHTCLADQLNIFETAIRFGNIPVLFASSDSVYGPNSSTSVLENAQLQPISMKGLFNFFTEQYGRFYALRYGASITAMRFFNVYGYWLEGWRGDVISRFCQAALTNQKLDVYGDGSQMRDFIYIEDAVAAIIAMTSSVKPGFSAVNISTGVGTTLNELVRLVGLLTATAFDVVNHPFRPGDLSCAVGNNQRLEALEGGVVSTELAEGLRRTMNAAGVITMRRSQA
ncbi:NAD-dependent epimerase/dehydratase family protein [Bacterioplanoides sp.]|uniref:NAD-dependent epimerase/dehydratase family protein n=1 Tax=Bacterioplanoides sp. TaxID=2066072 RepID=UPI003B5CE861